MIVSRYLQQKNRRIIKKMMRILIIQLLLVCLIEFAEGATIVANKPLSE